MPRELQPINMHRYIHVFVCVCVCVERRERLIYLNELACAIMKSDKSHNLLSAMQRPRNPMVGISILSLRPENQESHWYTFCPSKQEKSGPSSRLCREEEFPFLPSSSSYAWQAGGYSQTLRGNLLYSLQIQTLIPPSDILRNHI